MRIHAGTSGFAYKEWKGSFYPSDLKDGDMLSFYGERFDSVEINNTFYRMPSRSVLEGWAGQVPEDFSFILKASRRITHQKKLKEVGDDVAYLFGVSEVLGPRLGPVLFQLPPYLKKDLALLDDFLAVLPDRKRAALEVRSGSWLEDAVYDRLKGKGVALVVSDTTEEKTPDAVVVPTADWGYARLRRVEYTDASLEGWLERFREAGWSELFAFFKHEDEGTGPELARRFLRRAGIEPREPGDGGEGTGAMEGEGPAGEGE